MKSKLVIEFIDPATQSIRDDAILETDDLAKLLKLIDPHASDIPPGISYSLNQSDVELLSEFFEFSASEPFEEARLRRWTSWDVLPYKSHTNRELNLMLQGVKPLSAFCEAYPNDSGSEVFPESIFDQYSDAHGFVKNDCVFIGLGNQRKTRLVLYALPGEVWRIDAYLTMWSTAEKCGWNDGFERMQGTLLGYQEWQNDCHMAMRSSQSGGVSPV